MNSVFIAHGTVDKAHITADSVHKNHAIIGVDGSEITGDIYSFNTPDMVKLYHLSILNYGVLWVGTSTKEINFDKKHGFTLCTSNDIATVNNMK